MLLALENPAFWSSFCRLLEPRAESAQMCHTSWEAQVEKEITKAGEPEWRERDHKGWEAPVEKETTGAGKPEWRERPQGLGSPSGERNHKGWEALVEKETTRAGEPQWRKKPQGLGSPSGPVTYSAFGKLQPLTAEALWG